MRENLKSFFNEEIYSQLQNVSKKKRKSRESGTDFNNIA
jgi:hypothetical protein